MQLVRQKRIAANKKLFQEAVCYAERSLRKGHMEPAIAWCKIAAHFAFVRHTGVYTSEALENLLVELAQKVEKNPPCISGVFYLKSKPKNYGKMRFLHILSEGYGTGGHSSFIARWITNTLESSVHSVIATAQNGNLPKILLDAIQQSGGWYCSLPQLSGNLIEQSRLLRLLAQSWTDVIVLFVHPFDPLPVVAFGVEGGPPVILFNHADHAFWLGTSIADLVVDYHSTARKLNETRRGITKSAVLPIPLSKNDPQLGSINRRDLGITDDSVVLLTIGRDEKYLPFNRFDFLSALVDVLAKHSNAMLFAAGPADKGRWKTASEMVGGRIKALGTVTRAVLEKYYACADVYVVSFPCASGTAMLEAGLHGLPLVGLHIEMLPHLSMEDDLSFRQLGVHAHSVEEFKQAISALISNVTLRRQTAGWVRESIMREHCSPGWNNYLGNILQSLPCQHAIHLVDPKNEQANIADMYFEQLSSRMMCDELPEHSLGRLVRVYKGYLSKPEAFYTQVVCLAKALPKVNSISREKNFLLAAKDLFLSALT